MKKTKPPLEAEKQMVQGYLDGYAGESMPRKSTVAYRHGYRNGQDDLVGKPREAANTLRRRAAMILGKCEGRR